MTTSRLIRFAEIIAIKHNIKIAEELNKAEEIESYIRKMIQETFGKILYKNPHRAIIKQLATVNPTPGKNDTDLEKLAYKGWQFISEVISRMDYLLANLDTVDIATTRKILREISDLIQDNGEMKDGKMTFPSARELLFMAAESGRKSQRAGRDKAYGQIDGFFADLNGLINGGGSAKHHGLLNKMIELKAVAPEKFPTSEETDVDISNLPKRFEPGSAMLTHNEIMNFLLRQGDAYGLGDLDLNLWGRMVVEEPETFNIMTKIINTIRRSSNEDVRLGKVPVSQKIADYLKDLEQNFKLRRESNLNYLESSKPSAPTSVGPEDTILVDRHLSGYPKTPNQDTKTYSLQDDLLHYEDVK